MWVEEVKLVERGDTLYGLAHERPIFGGGMIDESYLVEQVLPMNRSGRVFVCSREGKLFPRPFHYRVLRREDGDFGNDGSRAEARKAAERQRIAARVQGQR